MSFSSEHILLACFDFPPNQGIGGRRWAKLAKGLARKGYHVHVIKSDPITSNTKSPWTDDTEHPNIHIHSIKRTYPQSVSHTGTSVFDKLMYRYHLLKLKTTEPGTIYDVAIGWELSFRKKAEELIRKWNIRNVIAT